MNKVTIEKFIFTPKLGDIYEWNRECYILSRIGPDKFSFISLENGNRLNDTCPDIADIELFTKYIKDHNLVHLNRSTTIILRTNI